MNTIMRQKYNGSLEVCDYNLDGNFMFCFRLVDSLHLRHLRIVCAGQYRRIDSPRHEACYEGPHV